MDGVLTGDALGFRGFIAPASLKAEAGDVFRLVRQGFRGFIAPASLKVRGALRPGVRTAGFRGFIAPASLKGGRRQDRRDVGGGVSGALSPRPH